MRQKIWRTSGICRSTNKLALQIHLQNIPSTLILVKREVFVYKYIHDCSGKQVCEYSMKNTCPTIVLMLAPCTT